MAEPARTDHLAQAAAPALHPGHGAAVHRRRPVGLPGARQRRHRPHGITLGLRDISRSACLLKGYPRVVATEPDHKLVTAPDGGYMVGRERPGNMPPGGVTWLNLETDNDCPAHNPASGRYPTRVYQTGDRDHSRWRPGRHPQPLDVLCGLFTGRFGVTEPPQRYINPPWTRVRVALELPASVTGPSTSGLRVTDAGQCRPDRAESG